MKKVVRAILLSIVLLILLLIGWLKYAKTDLANPPIKVPEDGLSRLSQVSNLNQQTYISEIFESPTTLMRNSMNSKLDTKYLPASFKWTYNPGLITSLNYGSNGFGTKPEFTSFSVTLMNEGTLQLNNLSHDLLYAISFSYQNPTTFRGCFLNTVFDFGYFVELTWPDGTITEFQTLSNYLVGQVSEVKNLKCSSISSLSLIQNKVSVNLNELKLPNPLKLTLIGKYSIKIYKNYDFTWNKARNESMHNFGVSMEGKIISINLHFASSKTVYAPMLKFSTFTMELDYENRIVIIYHNVLRNEYAQVDLKKYQLSPFPDLPAGLTNVYEPKKTTDKLNQYIVESGEQWSYLERMFVFKMNWTFSYAPTYLMMSLNLSPIFQRVEFYK